MVCQVDDTALLLLPRQMLQRSIYLPMELSDCNYVIIWTKIENGEQIRKSFIYTTRKALMEKAVVELVYKFEEKSYRECLTR